MVVANSTIESFTLPTQPADAETLHGMLMTLHQPLTFEWVDVNTINHLVGQVELLRYLGAASSVIASVTSKCLKFVREEETRTIALPYFLRLAGLCDDYMVQKEFVALLKRQIISTWDPNNLSVWSCC